MDLTSYADIIASNGVWAILFVFLFVYQLKDSHKREVKYQGIIDRLTEQLSVVFDIDEKVERLRLDMEKRFEENAEEYL